MEFALLFILAFLFGFAIYHFSRQWMLAVVVPIVLFCLSAFLDSSASTVALRFTLIFGVPIVFFASLLGAYVVQIRTHEEPDQAIDTTDEE